MPELLQQSPSAEVRGFLKKAFEAVTGYTIDALARLRNTHLETDERESEVVLKKMREAKNALAAAESILVDEGQIEEAVSEIVQDNAYEIFLQEHLVALRDAATDLDTVVASAVSDYLDWQIAGKYREREAVLEASKKVVAIKAEVAALERKTSQRHEPYESARYRLAMSISEWAAARGPTLYQDIQSMPDEYKIVLMGTTLGSTQQAENLFGIFAEKFAAEIALRQAEPTWQTLSATDQTEERRRIWDSIASGAPFLVNTKDLGDLVFENLDYVITGGLAGASADKIALVEKRKEEQSAKETLEVLVPNSAAYSRVLANVNTMGTVVSELPMIQAGTTEKVVAYLHAVAEKLGTVSQQLTRSAAEEEASLEATFTQSSPIVDEIKSGLEGQGILQTKISSALVETATPRTLMTHIESQEREQVALRREVADIFIAENSARNFAEKTEEIYLSALRAYSTSLDLAKRIKDVRGRKATPGIEMTEGDSVLDAEEKALLIEYTNLLNSVSPMVDLIQIELMKLNESLRREIESQEIAWDYIPENGSALSLAIGNIRRGISKIQQAANIESSLLPMLVEISENLANVAYSANIASVEIAKSKAQKAGELGERLKEISEDQAYREVVRQIVIDHEMKLVLVGRQIDSSRRGMRIIGTALSNIHEDTRISDVVDNIVSNISPPSEMI